MGTNQWPAVAVMYALEIRKQSKSIHILELIFVPEISESIKNCVRDGPSLIFYI